MEKPQAISLGLFPLTREKQAMPVLLFDVLPWYDIIIHLKCFNELNGTDYTEKEVWLEEDFCEGCADWRPCVMELHPKPIFWRLVDAIRRLFQK